MIINLMNMLSWISRTEKSYVTCTQLGKGFLNVLIAKDNLEGRKMHLPRPIRLSLRTEGRRNDVLGQNIAIRSEEVREKWKHQGRGST